MYKELLNKLKVVEIKEMIKAYNLHMIINMTKKTKAELIEELIKHTKLDDKKRIVLKKKLISKRFKPKFIKQTPKEEVKPVEEVESEEDEEDEEEMKMKKKIEESKIRLQLSKYLNKDSKIDYLLQTKKEFGRMKRKGDDKDKLRAKVGLKMIEQLLKNKL